MRLLIPILLVLVLVSCKKEEEQWPGPGNLYDPAPGLDSTGAAVYAIFIANSFTPNGDAVNDEFGPVGYGFSDNYQFNVFGRNGNEIFFTSYTGRGWNGTANYGGEICESGLYDYRVSFTDPSGIAREGYGKVQLVK